MNGDDRWICTENEEWINNNIKHEFSPLFQIPRKWSEIEKTKPYFWYSIGCRETAKEWIKELESESFEIYDYFTAWLKYWCQFNVHFIIS